MTPESTPQPGAGTSPTRRRKLHLGHFAFMRSVVQGLDTRESWNRYLRIEGEHSDLRAVRTTIAWIRDEFAAAARREHRHGLARLVQIDLTSLGGPAPALPSLEEFAAERGLAEFSQTDQLEAYQDAYGTPDAQARRRARLIAKQLESLRWLEELVAQPPLAGDAVASWLNPTLADRLETAGIMTLAQLIERINGVGYRWSGSIKAIGRAKAERILDWLAFHAGSIGMTVGQHVARPRSALARGELDAVVAPAAAIRPLEGGSGTFVQKVTLRKVRKIRVLGGAIHANTLIIWESQPPPLHGPFFWPHTRSVGSRRRSCKVGDLDSWESKPSRRGWANLRSNSSSA